MPSRHGAFIRRTTVLHWVVFAVSRPQGGTLKDRGGSNQGIAQFETVAFSKLAQIVSSALPDCCTGRGASQSVEQRFQSVVFGWARSRPEFGFVHRENRITASDLLRSAHLDRIDSSRPQETSIRMSEQ